MFTENFWSRVEVGGAILTAIVLWPFAAIFVLPFWAVGFVSEYVTGEKKRD